MKAKMLIFKLGCFLVQVLSLAICISLASEGYTYWAVVPGIAGLMVAYGDGKFVGWAEERYPHYFK